MPHSKEASKPDVIRGFQSVLIPQVANRDKVALEAIDHDMIIWADFLANKWSIQRREVPDHQQLNACRHQVSNHRYDIRDRWKHIPNCPSKNEQNAGVSLSFSVGMLCGGLGQIEGSKIEAKEEPVGLLEGRRRDVVAERHTIRRTQSAIHQAGIVPQPAAA